MPRDAVKDALGCHRSERQLGKVTTLEIFGDGIVECPQSATLEFFMARVAEFLHGIVDVASRKSLGIHKVDQKVSGPITRDFSLLVRFNPLSHVVPMRHDTAHGISENARQV